VFGRTGKVRYSIFIWASFDCTDKSFTGIYDYQYANDEATPRYEGVAGITQSLADTTISPSSSNYESQPPDSPGELLSSTGGVIVEYKAPTSPITDQDFQG
jgi:hypothetical protein